MKYLSESFTSSSSQLLFIDKVSNDRIYKNDRTKDLGIYAKYFEEELRNILESNYHKYKSILSKQIIAVYLFRNLKHFIFFYVSFNIIIQSV